MKKCFLLLALGFFLTANVSFCSAAARPSAVKKQSTADDSRRDLVVFPEARWLVSTPEAQGMKSEPLKAMDKLMKAAQANAVLIRNGYIVGEWNYAGSPDKKIETQSISKAITSVVLGILVKEGRISSIDAPVKRYYSALDEGPYTDKLTFRHFVTMTSGIAIKQWFSYVNPNNMPPGKEHHYHNDQYVPLTEAMTYLFGQKLEEVLTERLLSKLNAEMRWDVSGKVRLSDGRIISVNTGYAGTWWTARDLARVGYLYLNKGKWKDQQLLPESYINETMTEIPFKINEYWKPYLSKTDAEWVADRKKFLSNLRYGLGFWATEGYDGWHMRGNGGQFCLIMPKYNLVLAKVNSYSVTPFVNIDDFYPLIMESVKDN